MFAVVRKEESGGYFVRERTRKYVGTRNYSTFVSEDISSLKISGIFDKDGGSGIGRTMTFGTCVSTMLSTGGLLSSVPAHFFTSSLDMAQSTTDESEYFMTL